MQILIQDGVDDVGDVGRQAHLRAGEVDALTNAGEARREDLMPGRPERAADLAEAVRAAPRAVHQNEDRHSLVPSRPSDSHRRTLVTLPSHGMCPAIACRPRRPAGCAGPETVGTGSYDESVTRERLLAWRLANQHLAATRTADPAQLVAHFGAVQAQEYGQALWAIGLRTTHAAVGTIEAAVERGAILRTWPMRGTIHLVAAGDARWMVELLAGRRIRQMTGVYRKIGLTDEVLRRSGEIVAGALRGGRRVRRKDLYALLTGHGVRLFRVAARQPRRPHPRLPVDDRPDLPRPPRRQAADVRAAG